jgi:hypothetical protein
MIFWSRALPSGDLLSFSDALVTIDMQLTRVARNGAAVADPLLLTVCLSVTYARFATPIQLTQAGPHGLPQIAFGIGTLIKAIWKHLPRLFAERLRGVYQVL